MRLACLGDLLLDAVVRLDEPRTPGADAVALAHPGAGGQAATVAAAAAELGATALGGASGAGVSGDLSGWTAIREFGPGAFRERLETLAPDIVFANEPEWEIVGGAYSLARTAVVKRGARGITVLGEQETELPA